MITDSDKEKLVRNADSNPPRRPLLRITPPPKSLKEGHKLRAFHHQVTFSISKQQIHEDAFHALEHSKMVSSTLKSPKIV
jgi:hypothetical protein